MKILLDTYALLCFLENKKLPKKALGYFEDKSNSIYYSSISLFEIHEKNLVIPDIMLKDEKHILDLCNKSGLLCLYVEDNHMTKLDNLNCSTDTVNPYSRIIVAQAIYENMTLISHDESIEPKTSLNLIRL